MSEWLDRPDGDGWWWFLNETIGTETPLFVATLAASGEAYANGRPIKTAPHLKWARVSPAPPPPPKPLPRSRTVELTARVERDELGWHTIFMDGIRTLWIEDWKSGDTAKECAIRHARQHGIEPEVVGDES